MAIPDFQSLMLPLLRSLADGSERSTQETIDTLAEELGLTTNTQPVMLTAGIALWRAWGDAGGPPPVVMAGHSLGEYAALVAAGALSDPGLHPPSCVAPSLPGR